MRLLVVEDHRFGFVFNSTLKAFTVLPNRYSVPNAVSFFAALNVIAGSRHPAFEAP